MRKKILTGTLVGLASTPSVDLGGVSEAVGNGLKSVAGEMSGIITVVLPIGLGIVGAVLVVKFGIKIFKSLTGR